MLSDVDVKPVSLYSFIEGISKRSEKEPKKHGNDAVQYQLKK